MLVRAGAGRCRVPGVAALCDDVADDEDAVDATRGVAALAEALADSGPTAAQWAAVVRRVPWTDAAAVAAMAPALPLLLATAADRATAAANPCVRRTARCYLPSPAEGLHCELNCTALT